ncbi:MAG: DUF4863 family protein [Deltaproteobacteria bacterium]|nr:MAG: DUF4863 family protein [Deltaproteobacteria bacterium]
MSLVPVLAPYARAIAELDLAAADATDKLSAMFPYGDQGALREALLAAHAAGELTPKEGGEGIRFGRVAKATDETYGQSVDAVDIEGAGAEHTHVNGEVSFCIPLDGGPVFEGARQGWVVLPPGSHHTPTVTGGRMLIVYFLPGGEVRWGPKAA